MKSKVQSLDNIKASSERRSLQLANQESSILTQQTHPATIIQRIKLNPGSITSYDVLRLQRMIGNRAVSKLLARTKLGRTTNNDSFAPSAQEPLQHLPLSRNPNAGDGVIQRMVQPISWSDHFNVADPQNATGRFLEERILYFRYQRPSISNDTKAAVDGINDGEQAGTYKHYIPYDRIFQKMVADMESMTRGHIIGYLDTALDQLGIGDNSNLEPQKSRVEFDSWVTWAMEEICDWPQNIFRWSASSGDARGTAVDTPRGAPGVLTTRLGNAATALNNAIGVNIT